MKADTVQPEVVKIEDLEILNEEKMRIWNNVKQPPPSALKQIQAGRLRGKSDINPQWRYQVMTEQFGICGFGWRIEIVRQWLETAVEGQIFAFSNINLYVKQGGVWSCAIPGTGGAMLIEAEKAGLHCNDEAFKMATTDALGVAMKMLGVAADIYAGKWDGSKYLEKVDTISAKLSPQMEAATKKDSSADIDDSSFGSAQPITPNVGKCIILLDHSEKRLDTHGKNYWVALGRDGNKYRSFSRTVGIKIEKGIEKKLPVEIHYEIGKYGREIKALEVCEDVLLADSGK